MTDPITGSQIHLGINLRILPLSWDEGSTPALTDDAFVISSIDSFAFAISDASTGLSQTHRDHETLFVHVKTMISHAISHLRFVIRLVWGVSTSLSI